MTKHIEGNIVDLYNRRIFPGAITIEHGKIVSVSENKKRYDYFILPGFIDAHVHIESSMLTPVEFSKMAIKRGTIAVVNDPHEIANVLGKEGIKFMIDNSRISLIKMFFTIPSCVPSTSFDYSGDRILSHDVEDLIKSNYFVGLSEMMDVPAILNGEVDTIHKIEIAHKYHLRVDGHAPGLTGADLRRYVHFGISTDHECTTLDEAKEKIGLGMKILIREGSAAKNYDALKSLIKMHPDQVMFCTDDSHPGDLFHTGHIDKLVKRAISDGFDLFDILKIASINPIDHYGLNVGTLRLGETADFSIVDNLKDFNILSVYVNGIEKYNSKQELNSVNFDTKPAVYLNKFLRNPIELSDLKKTAEGNILSIGVSDGEIVTKKKIFSIKEPSVNLESDLDRDILKLVYLNRYQNSAPQIAYIHGIGLKRGAFATSISHDSHNIIAAGCCDRDICIAINRVISNKGGLVVADGESILELSLPIAGIMTDKDGMEVARIWDHLIKKLDNMGCRLSSPFMTLSFMALIVIPELKIGEKGLFEYSKFNFISPKDNLFEN